MADEGRFDPPTRSIGDAVEGGVRAGLSILPGGGAAAELYSQIVGTPLQRRQQEWAEQISSGLYELFERVSSLEADQLARNERFISVTMRASQVAVRTHQVDKRAALRNAVLNSAVGSDLSEDEEAEFIDLIDDLSPTHLRVLSWCHDPVAFAERAGIQYVQRTMGGLATRLEEAMPDLAGQREVYDRIVTELIQRGLLRRVDFHTTMTASSTLNKTSSARGDRFLDFILEPDVLH